MHERERGTAMPVIAEQLGVALETLYTWRRQGRRESVSGFVQLKVATPNENEITVQGVRICGVSMSQLAELLRALAA